jgi:hypothetical protein
VDFRVASFYMWSCRLFGFYHEYSMLFYQLGQSWARKLKIYWRISAFLVIWDKLMR